MPRINVVHITLPSSKSFTVAAYDANVFSVRQVWPHIHPCLIDQPPGRQTHQCYVCVWIHKVNAAECVVMLDQA